MTFHDPLRFRVTYQPGVILQPPTPLAYSSDTLIRQEAAGMQPLLAAEIYKAYNRGDAELGEKLLQLKKVTQDLANL